MAWNYQNSDFNLKKNQLIVLFKTGNVNLVEYCQECFSVGMPSDLWRKRVTKFESKFTSLYLNV